MRVGPVFRVNFVGEEEHCVVLLRRSSGALPHYTPNGEKIHGQRRKGGNEALSGPIELKGITSVNYKGGGGGVRLSGMEKKK